MKKINITNINEIGEILDYVHDRYFDLDRIRFDKNILVIPLSVILEEKVKKEKTFLIVNKWRNPVVEAELIFKNVTNYTIQDDAEIGEADINTIYQEGNQILVKCGIPVVIKLEITDFDIECVISDKIIDEIKRFNIAF